MHFGRAVDEPRLPRSVDVREAIFGKRGLAEGLAPGKLLIDIIRHLGGDTVQLRLSDA